MNTGIRIILLFLALLLHSCDKDEAAMLLPLKIISPQDGMLLHQSDSVFCQIVLMAGGQTSFLDVVLLNTAMIPYSVVQRVETKGNDTISFCFFPQRPDLASGDYFLKASSHGDGTTVNEFIRLRIEKENSDSMKIVSASFSDDSLSLYLLDNKLNVISDRTVFWNDSLQAALNPYSRQLILAGALRENIHALSLPSFTKVWETERPVFRPFRTANALCVYNDEVFAAYRQDYIRSYDENGHTGFTIMLEANERAGVVAASEQFVLFASSSPDGLQNDLKAYYRPTSAYHQEIELFFQLTAIQFFNADTVLLFGNDDQQRGVVYQYNIAGNLLTGPLDMLDVPLRHVKSCGYGRYAIHLQDAVWMYDYTRLMMYKIISLSGLKHIVYDAAKDQLWLLTSGERVMVDATNGLVQHRQSLPFDPQFFLLSPGSG